MSPRKCGRYKTGDCGGCTPLPRPPKTATDSTVAPALNHMRSSRPLITSSRSSSLYSLSALKRVLLTWLRGGQWYMPVYPWYGAVLASLGHKRGLGLYNFPVHKRHAALTLAPNRDGFLSCCVMSAATFSQYRKLLWYIHNRKCISCCGSTLATKIATLAAVINSKIWHVIYFSIMFEVYTTSIRTNSESFRDAKWGFVDRIRGSWSQRLWSYDLMALYKYAYYYYYYYYYISCRTILSSLMFSSLG